MLRWEDSGHSADDRADAFIELLLRWLVDNLLQGGAGFGVIVCVGHLWVPGEVVVMVSASVCHWAHLAWLLEVEVGVVWREDSVGRANDWTHLSSSHDDF